MALESKDLKIILQAQTAQFERALDKQNRKLNKFANTANKSTGRVEKGFGTFSNKSSAALLKFAGGLASAGAAVALFNRRIDSIKNSVDYADKIAKTAKVIGFTAEELQEYRHAAELSGVATNAFDKSLKRFNTSIGEADSGLATMKRSFDTIDVDIYDTEGRLKSASTLFNEVADNIHKAGSAAKEAEIAKNLFGQRGGLDLLNLLRQGSQGIKRHREELRELGIVSNETAKRAEDVADALTRQQATMKAIQTEIDIQSAQMVLKWNETKLSIVQATAALGEYFHILKSNENQANRTTTLIAQMEQNKRRGNNPAYMQNSMRPAALSDNKALTAELKGIHGNMYTDDATRARIESFLGEDAFKGKGKFNARGGGSSDPANDTGAVTESVKEGVIQGLRDSNSSAIFSKHSRQMRSGGSSGNISDLPPELEQERQMAASRAEASVRTWNDVAYSLTDSMQGLSEGALTVEDAFDSLINSMMQDMVWDPAADLLGKGLSAGASALFGGGGGGGGTTTNVNPHRAGGGSLMKGKAYMVGETGKEIFTPGDHGRLTPMNDNSKPPVVIHQHFAQMPSEPEARRMNQMAIQAVGATV